MPNQTLKLDGRITARAIDPDAQDIEKLWRIAETLNIKNRVVTSVRLDANGQEAVSLGDLAAANFVGFYVTRDNDDYTFSQVTMRTTTAVAAAQISIGTFYIIFSPTEDITAITVERESGVATEVSFLLGEAV